MREVALCLLCFFGMTMAQTISRNKLQVRNLHPTRLFSSIRRPPAFVKNPPTIRGVQSIQNRQFSHPAVNNMRANQRRHSIQNQQFSHPIASSIRAGQRSQSIQNQHFLQPITNIIRTSQRRQSIPNQPLLQPIRASQRRHSIQNQQFSHPVASTIRAGQRRQSIPNQPLLQPIRASRRRQSIQNQQSAHLIAKDLLANSRSQPFQTQQLTHPITNNVQSNKKSNHPSLMAGNGLVMMFPSSTGQLTRGLSFNRPVPVTAAMKGGKSILPEQKNFGMNPSMLNTGLPFAKKGRNRKVINQQPQNSNMPTKNKKPAIPITLPIISHLATSKKKQDSQMNAPMSPPTNKNPTDPIPLKTNSESPRLKAKSGKQMNTPVSLTANLKPAAQISLDAISHLTRSATKAGRKMNAPIALQNTRTLTNTGPVINQSNIRSGIHTGTDTSKQVNAIIADFNRRSEEQAKNEMRKALQARQAKAKNVNIESLVSDAFKQYQASGSRHINPIVIESEQSTNPPITVDGGFGWHHTGYVMEDGNARTFRTPQNLPYSRGYFHTFRQIQQNL